MFKRKPKLSSNPDVQEAIQTRDDLLDEVGKAIKEVDRVKDALLTEYEEAEKQRKGQSWS